MKIKCRPEDFRVDEVTTIPLDDGEFALYELKKSALTTHEAVDRIRARWRIDFERVAFAGLKDKYAETSQFITIRGGPARKLKLNGLELVHCGQASRPIHSSDIAANRFTIVVRSLSPSCVHQFERNLPDVERDGLANYFDDQRYGSLGESREFVAVPWCQGDYERALWLAVADANEHDRPQEALEKSVVRDHWRDWQYCWGQLPSCQNRSVFQQLRIDPLGFRAAIARIRPDLRSLYLAAFQSYVWDNILTQHLRSVLTADQTLTVARKLGAVTFYRQLTSCQSKNLESLVIPLPSARAKHTMGEFGPTAELILGEFGLSLHTMRLRYPRDSFFSKGDRRAIVRLQKVAYQVSDDELYPGEKAVTWSFELPRGSYATIAVKRCFSAV